MSNSEYVCGEFEEMDLSELYDHKFMVAIGAGKRCSSAIQCHTICGPFDFYAMVDTVAKIWEEQQLHAKVFIPHDEYTKRPTFLDEQTVDYIEAKYMDIAFDHILNPDKEYTCKAGLIEADEQNPST